MSEHGLRTAIARMATEPQFARRVREEPASVRAELDLTDREWQTVASLQDSADSTGPEQLGERLSKSALFFGGAMHSTVAHQHPAGFFCDEHASHKSGFVCNAHPVDGFQCNFHPAEGFQCDGHQIAGLQCNGFVGQHDPAALQCDGFSPHPTAGLQCNGQPADGFQCNGEPADGFLCNGAPVSLLGDHGATDTGATGGAGS
jgi:hypothetical protein